MRAIDLGPVEAAAIRTPGGKIRLRLLFTADQLEAMLIAAREDEQQHVTQCDASAVNVTPRLDESRTEEDDDDDDAPARPLPPTAPVGRLPPVFVIEGTRAWDAWLRAGHRPRLSVRRVIEGRTRSGWHFPTLFPPTATASTGPPQEQQQHQEMEEQSEEGRG